MTSNDRARRKRLRFIRWASFASVLIGLVALKDDMSDLLASCAQKRDQRTKRQLANQAASNVRRLYTLSGEYARVGGRGSVERFHRLSYVGPTPDLPFRCDAQGRSIPFPFGEYTWSHPTWQALGFSIAGDNHYRYTYQPDGPFFVVRAVGDLDCDGVESTFEYQGVVSKDGVQKRNGGMFTERELD